ncbi:S-DNA-T family DNA segregation ATPase FtsK/SpoIIIE [Microbacterium resistens]|uniref:S-DNA-T family DNA segregation ATPase FtsK/SpoIIIE n=1 Tax=Microbacterium resistens TaxID=156977 RepID=A0ABU1S7A1_9MICO|nr:type VII secretion protein EssC [Microbacterium resistens]MDR6865511.1 S-DNA-T family DNA segregation ATPase FtsK/SpoIIIE [Microbacterium resistens]
MSVFDTDQSVSIQRTGLDSRLDPGELLFLVHLLDGQRAVTLSLTAERPFVQHQGHKFSVINDLLYVDGDRLDAGRQRVGPRECVVVPAAHARTVTFVTDGGDLVIGDVSDAGIRVADSPLLVVHEDSLIVDARDQLVYVNGVLVEGRQICDLAVGTVVLTAGYLLERRPAQFTFTAFGSEIVVDPTKALAQPPVREFLEGFPDYRRSPKLNLETREAEFRLQGPDKPPAKPKNRLLRMVLPPLFMIVASGVTVMVTGSNPAMMLGLGLATLLTASFTVSQYVTEKKETRGAALKAEDDYARYLVRTVAAVKQAHDEEREVLRYQQPSLQELAGMVEVYDRRIYERQRFNRDFLHVSLGLSDRPSVLKVSSEVNDKDASDEAQQVTELATGFQTQRDVPTPISLAGQTLGFVGPPEAVQAQLQSLLFQTAFFHSYRDVNFVSLISREAYRQTWSAWRLLPHLTMQELNMRGLVYNDKLRDIVLNSFYQLLQSRKQVVKDAGSQQPQFAPHYVLTICDDRHLAGHGINELLAEDMSALGVTVIWCSEDEKLLPETVTALIQTPNVVRGELVTNDDVYVATPFAPYTPPEDLEHSLRKLSNLNHLEVEKNAVPEALSLLEQYEVKTVEELQIADRWARAEPNKSIASLIGWRGRSDHVHWDLHERAHGPHALVGGTTGSGKSEFLTTYLIGLAINFSPEDVGMLIIDWKGGGIANTLDTLPHFMGAITNLDGAGTARALASIKAELNKRQREFAVYGVNSINAYMSLYKQRHAPKPDVKYPTKPLPHLVLVSDEFAELKANVPEFLDELTSVARIGRSLGVHLILATQKPSGVVNDQIEANSTSKIALKMASEQDSNELLKTTDAAHITNPGRGYLKVGQNEVYELFQSGYAGVPYDPDAVVAEQVDERIYTINEVGQYELFYDPDEEVAQGKDTSDLPTQLGAVIDTIVAIFRSDAALTIPDKPWLPNLEASITTPEPAGAGWAVPLGMLDVPSRQAQENYDLDLTRAGHTVVFGSPGYGKSTVLQTLVMGLARTSTPEQLHLNLIDFGNNGLLPLKDLPHVADIVTLEESEKLGKMLDRVAGLLVARKQLFKDSGVANLEQYTAKARRGLPIVVTVLDGYDNLTANDRRKDQIDNLLLQVLREGAGLGVYLVMSASRVGGVRVNMLSNISTKLCLYLNDEGELAQLMGRERLVQVDVPGRGQVLTDAPTAIQFYQPAPGGNSSEALAALEQRVAALNAAWTGARPAKIPMVPRELTPEAFVESVSVRALEAVGGVPLGLSMASTEARGFLPRSQPCFVFAAKDDEQELLFQETLLTQGARARTEFLIVDFDATFEEALERTPLPANFGRITSRSDANQIVAGIVAYLNLNKQKEQGVPTVLVIANLPDFITVTGLKPEDFVLALKNTFKAGLDFVIFSRHDHLAKSFDPVPKLLRELKFTGLIGARAYDSPLVKSMGASSEPEPNIDEPFFVLRGGSTFEKVKLPQARGTLA